MKMAEDEWSMRWMRIFFCVNVIEVVPKFDQFSQKEPWDFQRHDGGCVSEFSSCDRGFLPMHQTTCVQVCCSCREIRA